MCLLMVAATEAAVVAPDAAEKPDRLDPGMRKLLGSVRQLLVILDEQHLLDAGTENARLAVLQGILDGLGCDGTLVQSGHLPAAAQPDDASAGALQTSVVRSRYLHIVPKTISNDATIALRKVLRGDRSERLRGLVIDLRHSAPTSSAEPDIKRFVTCVGEAHLRTAVLIGSNTIAEADALAEALRAQLDAVVIGAPPKERKATFTTRLPGTEMTLILSTPAPETGNIIRPDVTARVPATADDDDVLRQAVDLIVVLESLALGNTDGTAPRKP
mgnify:CR=1 FL=1